MPDVGQRVIRVSLPDAGLGIRLVLLDGENFESCEAVWNALPLESTLGHVVVSGGGIWIPTKIVHIGATRSVQRTVGSAYFNGPMQTLSVTYGDVSESAFVNEFARVMEQDLDVLKKIGELVWDQTVEAARKTLTRVLVERA